MVLSVTGKNASKSFADFIYRCKGFFFFLYSCFISSKLERIWYGYMIHQLSVSEQPIISLLDKIDRLSLRFTYPFYRFLLLYNLECNLRISLRQNSPQFLRPHSHQTEKNLFGKKYQKSKAMELSTTQTPKPNEVCHSPERSVHMP